MEFTALQDGLDVRVTAACAITALVRGRRGTSTVRQSESANPAGQIGHQDLVGARPCLNDSGDEEAGCETAELSLRRTVLGQPRASGDREG